MKRILTAIFMFFLLATLAFGTVTNTELPPKQYVGNDLTTNFPITFDYVAESDLSVSVVVDATGVVTAWTQDIGGATGYTISSDEIVANTAPATGETLVIDSETAITQNLDLKNNRKTAAELLEAAYDKNTLISRDNAAKLDRALVAPATGDPDVSYVMPDYSASEYIQWHPTSKELRNAAPVSLSTTVGTDVGDVVALVDVGGNAGWPALAGENLTGLTLLNGSQPVIAKGADVASASELPILTDGNYFDVTGAVTITSIATTGSVGMWIKLHFDAALTLTHHATDLILPTGANIITEAGDEAEFVEYASGDFRCTNYQRATGEMVNRDSTIKGWISFNGTGTIAINDSFNVASIADNGVGDYTITWDTDFANTNYVVIVNAGDVANRSGNCVAKTNGTSQINTITVTTGAPTDVAIIDVIAIGLQ